MEDYVKNHLKKPKTKTGHTPHMICKDGYNVSMQANKFVYCSPRQDNVDHYDEVELGLPSEHDDLLTDYAEDMSKGQTKTIFPYTPVEIVNELIHKHGGPA